MSDISQIPRITIIIAILIESGLSHATSKVKEAFSLLPESAMAAMSNEELCEFVKNFSEITNKYFYSGMD